MANRMSFYAGVFLLCMSVLALQVVQTRLLSVVGWYHLAFFAISMAMFGLTAGAVYVYLHQDRFDPVNLSFHLTWTTSACAVSMAICLGFQLASVAVLVPWATSVFIWAKIALLLAPPFFFAGMAISLALTRSPFPVGRVYGADLAGAAAGCLATIALLNLVDAPSAILLIAAVAAAAAALFARAGIGGWPQGRRGPWRFLVRPTRLAVILLAAGALNASTPHGLQPVSSKDQFEPRDSFAVERWNSFSRVVAQEPRTGFPHLWGPSPKTPEDLRIEQANLHIDGSAGTVMIRFDGDLGPLDFLRYDITNLGYFVRDRGRAAVIGVGGGRDLLSAHYFGFRDVTGVEVNQTFVDLLTRNERFRSFSALATLPHVRLVVDDARSWFARTRERFDLIQMSMVDTWASTGAGGLSLSENGLYTVEGWRHFLTALAPDGVFVVSRWYGGSDGGEIGRLVSLAMAALFATGAERPADHIFLAGQSQLATIIVGARPLAAADVAKLTDTASWYDYRILLSPGRPASSALFADLLGASSTTDLALRAAPYPLDLSPPTDARPFFFNQLRFDPRHLRSALQMMQRGGVASGNLYASGTLLLLILLSAFFVVTVIVLPLRSTVRVVDGRLAAAGTAYFLLIGLGFMLVEIGLIQRISVFLGHPTYALSIGLFSIILSTGLGSLLSDSAPLNSPARFAAWAVALGAYLLLLPTWLPGLLGTFEAADLLVRGTVCLAAIMPAGLLMGFGFPTGLTLVAGVDAQPAPWFWGVNGAAGVLAAGLAVACSIALSIDTTFYLGGVCYLSLVPAAMALFTRAGRAPTGSASAPAS